MLGNMTPIRDFVPSDLSALRQMMHGVIDASYSGVYPERAVAFFKTFHSEERILERSQKGETLIIERNDGIAATGAIVNGEASGVFVRLRDQGKGYGKAVMKETRKEGKRKGFHAGDACRFSSLKGVLRIARIRDHPGRLPGSPRGPVSRLLGDKKDTSSPPNHSTGSPKSPAPVEGEFTHLRPHAPMRPSITSPSPASR